MGAVQPPLPVMFLVAAFSRHHAALDWARARIAERWGAIALESPRFDFQETNYYEPTMGSAIKKCFRALERPVDPGCLAERKLASNSWELEYAALGGHSDSRPLNIDPGYLTLAKLVLASTKDHAHRLYLAEGIFAEVTLVYRDRCWQPRPWTFPDYRRADYQAFFSECREQLKHMVSRTREPRPVEQSPPRPAGPEA